MTVSIEHIHADRLAETLQSNGDDIALVDVRREDEWQFNRIDGAIWIPLDQLPMRAREIDAAKQVVLYCHHGVRSWHAAEYLAAQGFQRLASLDGGIDAWAEHVDPNVPRY